MQDPKSPGKLCVLSVVEVVDIFEVAIKREEELCRLLLVIQSLRALYGVLRIDDWELLKHLKKQYAKKNRIKVHEHSN